MLLRPFPPFASVEIGNYSQLRIVNRSWHSRVLISRNFSVLIRVDDGVSISFSAYAAIPRSTKELAVVSVPHAIPQQICAFFSCRHPPLRPYVCFPSRHPGPPSSPQCPTSPTFSIPIS